MYFLGYQDRAEPGSFLLPLIEKQLQKKSLWAFMKTVTKK